MKYLIFNFLLLFTSIHIFSQTVTFKDVQANKKGTYKEYVASNGASYKIGDTLTLGVPFTDETFDYIFQIDPMGVQTYPLENLASNSHVKIKKIQVYSKTTRITATKPNGHALNIVIINFDEAINQGEIKSSILTSDQALEKLKKEKDKLDLQIITQSQYDSVKIELQKHIK